MGKWCPVPKHGIGPIQKDFVHFDEFESLEECIEFCCFLNEEEEKNG